MSDIVKKESSGIAPWDPFEGVRDLLRWDPFREMAPVSFRSLMPRFERTGWAPTFEVRENKDAYLFKADLPGVKSEDLEVSLTGNRLAIHGKRDAEQQDKGDTYYTYERSYGSFTRAFTLPEGADVEHMRADLKDGVLTVIVPKTADLKPRKINVTTAPAEKH